MVEDDEESIINLKFILYCFEWLSSLKINYHKNEAYIFGMDLDDKTRIANMLNCQLGELPIRYLGVSISDTKLGKVAFAELTGKLLKGFPHGRVSNLFWGGGGGGRGGGLF
jgi:hypothetical protein